jgi:hypothetical protein
MVCALVGGAIVLPLPGVVTTEAQAISFSGNSNSIPVRRAQNQDHRGRPQNQDHRQYAPPCTRHCGSGGFGTTGNSNTTNTRPPIVSDTVAQPQRSGNSRPPIVSDTVARPSRSNRRP